MKKMWAVYAVVAAIIYLTLSTLHAAGSFKSIHPHTEGTVVQFYDVAPGTEDIDLDEFTGRLFISSTDRRKTLTGQDSDDGIYAFVPASESIPKRIPTTFKGVFHPHGISVLRSDSVMWLFVVNHDRSDLDRNAEKSTVEIFQYRNDTLVHMRTIASEMMCCPNDVVGVEQDKFYVTNDHGTNGGFKRTLEDYLRIPLSYLLYYDGANFTKAHTGLRYGNGINISRDGSLLYATTTTGQNLLTFDRDKTSGQLTLKSKFPLKTGLDNVDVDTEGNLWIAAHPKLLKFVSHAKDETVPSPSQVLKLTPQSGTEPYSVQEIYMDDGTNLSGSSCAVRVQNEIFIGVVFDRKILRLNLAK